MKITFTFSQKEKELTSALALKLTRALEEERLIPEGKTVNGYINEMMSKEYIEYAKKDDMHDCAVSIDSEDYSAFLDIILKASNVMIHTTIAFKGLIQMAMGSFTELNESCTTIADSIRFKALKKRMKKVLPGKVICDLFDQPITDIEAQKVFINRIYDAIILDLAMTKDEAKLYESLYLHPFVTGKFNGCMSTYDLSGLKDIEETADAYEAYGKRMIYYNNFLNDKSSARFKELLDIMCQPKSKVMKTK